MGKTTRGAGNGAKKLLWAVDPFEGSTKGVGGLAHIAQAMGAKIAPVHVLSDGLLGLSVPPKIFRQVYEPMARARLDRFLKRTAVAGAGTGQVVVAVPSSRSTAAEALDRHAQREKAALIFVPSHGRSGISRALLGSFAETLVLHARTPVLISGPKGRLPEKIETILFPTDFGKAAEKAFAETIKLAKALKARLVVHHAVPDPADVLIASGAALLGGAWVYARPGIEARAEKERKVALAWVEKARRAGVSAQAVVDVGVSSVVLSVVAAARKKKASLIAMSSQSSGFSAAVLGSIGREIARQAPCATLFYRHSR